MKPANKIYNKFVLFTSFLLLYIERDSKGTKMEFFRKNKKIIVAFLTIFLIAWMVGIGALLSVLF